MQIRMDWRAVRFDWTRLRAFLVTAEEGSLSAASRALGLTQPTLGRQVAALEEELGVALFERTGRGQRLTPSGLDLLEHAREMGEAARRVSLAASGRAEAVEGTIRISASEIYAAHLLPPILAELRRAHPGVELEIVASNAVSDLRRREADIAVRHVRPEQPELIARLIGTDRGAFYGTPDHVAERGGEVSLIGWEESGRLTQMLRGLGVEPRLAIRSESQIAQWGMVRAGAGIGVAPLFLGDADPALMRALPWAEPIEYPVWLVSHRELRMSRRVRLVFEALAEGVAGRIGG